MKSGYSCFGNIIDIAPAAISGANTAALCMRSAGYLKVTCAPLAHEKALRRPPRLPGLSPPRSLLCTALCTAL